MKIADAVDFVIASLTAASAAQRAGNATSYTAAMADAKTAFLTIRDAIKGN